METKEFEMLNEGLKIHSTFAVLNLGCWIIVINIILVLQIKQLIKTDNSIGVEGGRMICETLKNNTGLTELWLGGNNKLNKFFEYEFRKNIFN